MTTVAFEVVPDQESLRDSMAYFQAIGGNTRDVMRVGINKAGPKIRTKSSQQIRKSVRLKASYVNDKLKFVRATNAKLSGRISTPTRGILTSRYSTDSLIASDKKVSWIKAPPVPARGIRVRIKANSAAVVFKGVKGRKLPGDLTGKPFYMLLKNSGAVGIVRRRKNGKIHVFHGPSVSQIFDRVSEEVLPEAGQIYTKELQDAVRYLLAKRRAPNE